MTTSFTTQTGNGEYKLQFETDSKELYLLMLKTTGCCIEAEDTNVRTNADRIRAMSDDELNDLFYEIYNAGVEDASSYEWGQRTNSFEWTMEWLQKPAEGEK